jgi:streptomycin 6-kinase
VTVSELDLDALRALGVDQTMIDQRIALDGRRAMEFLAELPLLASDSQQRLGLSGGRILAGGVLSAVLACRRVRDGARVVLKLSAAHATSPLAEAAALQTWRGVGACTLRWASADGRAMVMEAIEPGRAVKPGDEGSDARRAGALLRLLHRHRTEQIPEAIPGAAAELHWRFGRAHRQLDGPSHARGMISHADIEAALERALALDRQCTARVLCHGDFIDKNILLGAGGEWRAIDPRPCVGDPCLDAGFWALAHRAGNEVRRRCELIADCAGLDPERVWSWAHTFAVSEAVLVTDAGRARAHHSVSR